MNAQYRINKHKKKPIIGIDSAFLLPAYLKRIDAVIEVSVPPTSFIYINL